MYYIFLAIYIYLYYNFKNGIYSVPGSIQFNMPYLIKYLLVLFCNKYPKTLVYDKINGYKRIYGYSCRQLFETYIKIRTSKNKNLNIAVTPIHHTSFRNIIEKYFSEERIFILDLDKYYEKVLVPEKYNDINFDIILVSHVWGYNLDLSQLEKYRGKSFLIEDSVLGCEYFSKTVTDSDMYFHSCGMDKRPSSLFGGYVDVKDIHKDDLQDFSESVSKLPIVSFNDKYKKIRDVFMLFCIYNIRFIQQNIKLLCYLFNYKLSDVSHYIRKSKPGFQHDNYMKCPNQYMVDEMISVDKNVTNTEKVFKMKNANFKSLFSSNVIQNYFPWKFNVKQSTLPYNPILIKSENQESFLKFFNQLSIPVLKNPTYVTFEHSGPRYKEFLDNIFYLPNLYTMDYNEQITLINYVQQYISQNKLQ